MDRLSTVVALAAVALGSACADDKPRATGSRERVNAVHAHATKAPDPEAMCDVFYAPTDAPVFVWPKLAETAPPAREGSWRWVNVWATWCKPCVEEIPRLVKWHASHARKGPQVDLLLVSADETADEVESFRKSHPAMPPGPRLAEPDDLPAWMKSLGVPGATLPVHVFVDARERVRCVRASGIEDSDFPAIELLLEGGPRLR